MPRAERAFRTPALILKRRDFAEADRLLTVLTPQYGKLDVIAKGARKPTSHSTGQVELFTRAEMLIHRGRELGIIGQVEMTAPYQLLREDLTRGAYASYAAELTDRFATEGEEEFAYWFMLLDDTFARLCNRDTSADVVIRYYEVHLLGVAGFQPELGECVVSHEPIQPQDQYFSFALGGVVSPPYVHLSDSSVPISMNALKLLRHIQRSPFSQMERLQVPAHVQHEAEGVMLGYITYLLERKLQSVAFIRQLRRLA